MDTKGYRLFIYDDIDKKKEEDDDDDGSVLRSDYWKQINDNNNWKPLTDRIYTELDENGWLDDLLFMNKDIEKSNFEMKRLTIKESHKIGLIQYDEDVVAYFNNFDIELRSMQKYPFKMLMYIDYNIGEVFLIKYKN